VRARAFTLIELLIVVAIIAILAAIAVPNFLEAQVRAKVSRTKADMRSIATGLEAYRVDENHYPPWADWRTTDAPGSDYYNDAALFHAKIPNFITTPVAYLTSISRDVFVRSSTFSNARYPVESGVGFRFQYFPYDGLAVAPTTSAAAKITNGYRAAQTGGWLFYSFGPDFDDNRIGSPREGTNAVYTRYDSTNGTVSTGNIIRTAASPEGQIPRNPNITNIQNGPN
jgi:prepilin-type N-terminal cleavage/methylation domain-containing protein